MSRRPMAEFDVTLSRHDSVFGPTVIVRRVFACSATEAKKKARAELDAIWVHPWTITGFYSYAGELGRGLSCR